MKWIAQGLRKRSGIAAMAAAAVVLIGVLPALGGAGIASPGATKASRAQFRLYPNPPFLPCVQAPGQAASATVTVVRGAVNDALRLQLYGFRPNLTFDMFTVQNSNLLPNGQVDPNFGNFGLAWYQSEVQVGADGTSTAVIRTILLDEIFGFDPAVSLTPVNTYHLGIWFDDPTNAMPCGFTGITPFNGTHDAGPVAFITRPDAVNNLGPLCTDPAGPGVCNIQG